MQEQDNLEDLLKTFAKGSFIVLIGVVISKIATYLYKAIVARTFGQEIYGLFSLAVMISVLFASVFSFGLQSGLLRYISFYRGKNEIKKIKSIFRFSLLITLFSGFIGGILLFLFSESISLYIFHTSELTIFLQWFAVFMPIFVFAGLFHVITLAYERIGWYSFIANILSPSMQLIFLGIFIFLGLKVEAITISYNLGFFVILLSSFLVCRYGIKTIFGKAEFERKEKLDINKKLFSYSWPIMFFGLVMSIFAWIDSFTIGYLKTASDVGIYNAAIPIAVLLEIAPALFLQLFLPIITKEYSRKNFKLIKKLSKQIGKWIFILNLPILVIMILFPGTVINILFGANYIQAENSLRFLSIGLFFYSIFKISENLLSMIGKSRTILYNLLVACIINITLNVLLIPKYGIDGAAFSTMISYIFWSILSFFVARRHTSVNPLKTDMFKIILVAIVPSLMLFYVRRIVNLTTLNIILLGLSFVIIYFSLIILTHSFDKNDLMILNAVKNKILKKSSN